MSNHNVHHNHLRPIGYALAAGVTAAMLVVPAAAAQADVGPTAAPQGTVVAPFGATNTSESEYSVQIAQNGPANAEIPPQFTVSTTGFAPGNWGNLWYRPADANGNPIGEQNSWGGAFLTSNPQVLTGSSALPPGRYIVQASVGKWPEEQWTPYLLVTVSADRPTTTITSNVTTITPTTDSIVASGSSSNYPPGTPVRIHLGLYDGYTKVGADGSWSMAIPNQNFGNTGYMTLAAITAQDEPYYSGASVTVFVAPR